MCHANQNNLIWQHILFISHNAWTETQTLMWFCMFFTLLNEKSGCAQKGNKLFYNCHGPNRWSLYLCSGIIYIELVISLFYQKDKNDNNLKLVFIFYTNMHNMSTGLYSSKMMENVSPHFMVKLEIISRKFIIFVLDLWAINVKWKQRTEMNNEIPQFYHLCN